MQSCKSSRPGLPGRLLLIGAVGAIIGFAWSEKDYVAAVTLTVVVGCGISGYILGAVRLVGAVGGLTAAYHFTPVGARWLAPHMLQWMPDSPGVSRLVSMAFVAAVIICTVTLATTVMSRWLTNKQPWLEASNHSAGFGLGVIQGMLVMLVLWSGIVAASPLAASRLRYAARDQRDSLPRTLAQHLVTIASQVKHSTVGPVIANYNPFETMLPFERAIIVIKDPQILNNVSSHPVLAKLQHKPSVRAAMDSIANDPELREIALSGKAIDGQTALALLNNPTISKLLEQPDLIQDITQAIAEIDSSAWARLMAENQPGPHARPRSR